MCLFLLLCCAIGKHDDFIFYFLVCSFVGFFLFCAYCEFLSFFCLLLYFMWSFFDFYFLKTREEGVFVFGSVLCFSLLMSEKKNAAAARG